MVGDSKLLDSVVCVWCSLRSIEQLIRVVLEKGIM